VAEQVDSVLVLDELLLLDSPIPLRLAQAGQVEPATVLPAQTQCFQLLLRLAEVMALLHLHHLALQALLALAVLEVALAMPANPAAQEILHQ